MNKTRLKGFSDVVIAVFDHDHDAGPAGTRGLDLTDFANVLPALATYLLSFAFVGIYWNNHHHLLHATSYINGVVLRANLHLLFWLSLVPFATRWMSETDFAVLPMASYGVVLLLSALGAGSGGPAADLPAMAITASIGGRLSDRVGTPGPTTLGGLFVSIGLLLLSRQDESTPMACAQP